MGNKGDTHFPESGGLKMSARVVENFDAAVELAKRSGFTEYRRFAGGQYESVPF